MELYGHTGTVNCLDLHGDRLVSGSKDGYVKGKQPPKDVYSLPHVELLLYKQTH